MLRHSFIPYTLKRANPLKSRFRYFAQLSSRYFCMIGNSKLYSLILLDLLPTYRNCGTNHRIIIPTTEEIKMSFSQKKPVVI